MKNEIEIEIKVDGDVWQKALDKAFKKKNKDIRIEGFRKGTAPKNIYLRKFGIESLYMDAVDFALSTAYPEALNKAEITPIIEPNVDVKSINDKEVVFTFIITGKPEVTLGEYKNLGLKKDKAKVTEKEIDEEVVKLQNQLAEIVPKEKGKVEKGNTAVIDFEGFVDGKSIEGGKDENFPLEIGSNTFIPGFEDGVIGMTIGETKDLNLKFPDDYVPELKGKDVRFHVTVREIKERIIPEVNTDFYQDLGYEDIKTEEEFRDEVKSVILERKEKEIDDAYLEKCLETAANNMKVEISNKIIDEEIHRMIHQFEEQLQMQGVKIDEYSKITGITHEKMHEQMEPEATKRVKYRLLIEAIADAEDITFTDEEVNKKAEEMANNYGISVDELIKAYGSLDVVKYDMRMHEALEIIKNNN